MEDGHRASNRFFFFYYYYYYYYYYEGHTIEEVLVVEHIGGRCA